MKRKRIYYIIGLLYAALLLQGNWAIGQVSPSYFFDEDQIVFQFDIRDYDEATTKEGKVKKLDFRDFDIRKVAISGNFNAWSEKGWKMKKVGLFTYQLRKRIDHFDDAFPLEFKFIINEQYFAATGDRIPLKLVYDNAFFEEAYAATIHEVRPTENGNAEFFLAGFPDAKRVILAGDFVGWDEDYLEMVPVDGGWELAIALPPGRYEYKFIVDGEWMHDPANSKMVKNEHSTFNSILFITQPVTFVLEGFPDAKQVMLAGSFNDWKERDLEMEKEAGKWTLTLPLLGGKHHYKFIVDGEWIVDPDNPLREDDGRGNVNSVLLVQ